MSELASKALYQRGYPEGSLLPQLRLPCNDTFFVADLAIVNVRTHQILALVEIINFPLLPDRQLPNIARLSEVALSQSPPLPAFIVSSSGKPGSDLEYARVLEGSYSDVRPIEMFPSYQQLINNRNAMDLLDAEQQIPRLQDVRDSSIARLRFISVVVTLIAGAALLLDALQIYTLTSERIAFFAGLAILWLLPHVERIKFMGVEINTLRKHRLIQSDAGLS